MNWDWLMPVVAIAGLAVITVVTRAFFMLPEREIPLPDWLRRGLKYAPLAALTAVIAPEIVMSQGSLITTLQDARLPAVPLRAPCDKAPVPGCPESARVARSADCPRCSAWPTGHDPATPWPP